MPPHEAQASAENGVGPSVEGPGEVSVSHCPTLCQDLCLHVTHGFWHRGVGQSGTQGICRHWEHVTPCPPSGPDAGQWATSYAQ